MVLAKILLVTGSLILLLLGGIHLVYTFLTNKFLPRAGNLEKDMKNSYPILTRRTTMWKAWVGFNASHSLGGIFFGTMNIYVCLSFYPEILQSIGYFSINICTLVFYSWLAVKYWFSIPRNGIFISLICFIAAAVISVAN